METREDHGHSIAVIYMFEAHLLSDIIEGIVQATSA